MTVFVPCNADMIWLYKHWWRGRRACCIEWCFQRCTISSRSLSLSTLADFEEASVAAFQEELVFVAWICIQGYSKSKYEITRKFNRKYIRTMCTFVKWQLGNFCYFLPWTTFLECMERRAVSLRQLSSMVGYTLWWKSLELLVFGWCLFGSKSTHLDCALRLRLYDVRCCQWRIQALADLVPPTWHHQFFSDHPGHKP